MENKQDDGLVKQLDEQLQLSEAWRSLLGMEREAQAPSSTPVREWQLANDPWAALVQAQGIQIIDLQQESVRSLQPSSNDGDVEHALDNLQERQS